MKVLVWFADGQIIKIEQAVYGRLVSDDGTQATCTHSGSHDNRIDCSADR